MMMIVIVCTEEEKLNIFDECKLLNLTNYKQAFFAKSAEREKRKTTLAKWMTTKKGSFRV